MGRTRVKLAIAVAVLGVAGTTTAAIAGGGGKSSAKLSGFEEVPVVLTDGDGKFKARINRSAQTIDYTLRYEGLEGGSATQAHIHVGQELVNGGIAAWLCAGGAGSPPAGTPACPLGPNGEVSGTITAAQILAIPMQSLDAGDFDALVGAMRRGLTYANVHTTQSPGGEIRGQIDGKGGNGKDDDNGRGGGRGGDDDSDSDSD